MKMMFTLGVSAMLSCVSLPLALQAQSGPTELSVEEATKRIDLAARQRMLIERMAKSVCFAETDVHVWDNELYMQGARVSFEIAHRGILEGDEKLGITGETDRNFRETWNDLDLTWRTLDRIYDKFVEGEDVTEQDMRNIMSLTETAHDHSDELVIQMRTNYAQFIGDNGFGNSILLDLYSKQKELLQELSKNVCLTAAGMDTDASLSNLNTNLSQFQASLDGFRSGMPNLGIPAPPTERITIQLDRTNDRWEEIRAYAETIAAGEQLEAQELSDLEFGIDQVLREVDRVVFLLVDHIRTNG
ncbi:type IV pili methyl-accepting chemotaxis transducer N-terminal domain-containing protein [Yoonia sp. SS1-5]|uniref:Type IV pili methyl-accepting chemotaxis transducer N-terminal domain-containing protein n=1 Tax=Yoonia rhodophyticola TaxID=3137370 RepID=A0AAN0NI68_9RHOB